MTNIKNSWTINEYYAVKDELSQMFLTPALFSSEEEAKRAFKTQINTITLWKENSSDFSLYRVGTWNTETGELTSKIEKIINGRSVLNWNKD